MKKMMKKIMTIAFVGIGLSTFAQTRMANISEIADVAIENCEGPKLGQDEATTKRNLSLYPDYYKQGDYKSSLEFWRQAFFSAPKASTNLYIRGVKMYKTLSKEAEGSMKESLLDTMFAIHETRVSCFGATSSILKSRSFDWYNKRLKGNDEFVFNMFNETYDTYVKEEKGNNVPANFLLPWVNTAIRTHKNAKTIDENKVLEVFEIVTNIVDFNMAAGNDAGKYKGSLDAIMKKLNKYDYLNCESIVPIAEKKYRADPENETVIIKTYKSLKAGSCTSTPLFMEVATKLVKIKPSAALYKFLASKESKAGNASKALEYLHNAVDLTEGADEKSVLYMKIASAHYKNGSYGKVRENANKALELRPNWGEPYLVIGRTYASSGKICGTGNDFKSHTVTWIAIDTWAKAKSVDASVSEEAQKLINKYSQYMPTKEELFRNNIKPGSSYTVSCLGKTTTARTSD